MSWPELVYGDHELDHAGDCNACGLALTEEHADAGSCPACGASDLDLAG